MSKTIAVLFTTDEEAGKVYGTIRRLKREGYFHTCSMYDNYALIFAVGDADVDTVLNVFNDITGLEATEYSLK